MRCAVWCVVAALSIGCGKSESKTVERAQPAKAKDAEKSAPSRAASEPAEIAQMRARQAALGGPVPYEKFAAVLEERIGPFTAVHALEGVNQEIAEGVVLATGTRQYRDGERLLIVTITGTFSHQVAPRLRGEKPAEGEPALGAVKNGKVGRYPAVFSWHAPSGESQTFVLVGDRVVDVRVVSAKTSEDSIAVANLLQLDVLPTLRPEKK